MCHAAGGQRSFYVLLLFTAAVLCCTFFLVLRQDGAPTSAHTLQDAENSNIELVRLLHNRVKQLEEKVAQQLKEKGCGPLEREVQDLTARVQTLSLEKEKAQAKKVELTEQFTAEDGSIWTPSCFRGKSKKLAILVPLYRPMWGRTVESFRNWHTNYNTPACHLTSTRGRKVDLILYTNKWYGGSEEENKKKLSVIVDILTEGNVAQCFDSIRFMTAGLDNATDPEKGRNNRAISEFFFSMFFNSSLQKDGYDYFFHMETDTRPIRPYWVDRLYEEVDSRLSEFWMLGTIYRGSAHPKDFCYGKFSGCAEHINGNAVYNLQDKEFIGWLEELHNVYEEGKHHMSWGFDTYIINVLKRESSWGFLQKWAHKFVYSDLIQHGQRDPLREVLKKYPNTFFTHQTIDG